MSFLTISRDRLGRIEKRKKKDEKKKKSLCHLCLPLSLVLILDLVFAMAEGAFLWIVWSSRYFVMPLT